MQENIKDNRPARRKAAIGSAACGAFANIVSAVVLLWLRGASEGAFLGRVLLILAGINLVAILPIIGSLMARLKEIEGGEEDAASQY